MQDLAEHNSSSRNADLEQQGSDPGGDLSWIIWFYSAVEMLGHGLDGDDTCKEAGDGYSLDEALDHFEARKSPAEYVSVIRARDRYKGKGRA